MIDSISGRVAREAEQLLCNPNGRTGLPHAPRLQGQSEPQEATRSQAVIIAVYRQGTPRMAVGVGLDQRLMLVALRRAPAKPLAPEMQHLNM